MFKVFEVRSRLNSDDVIINFIMIYNINKYIKSIKIENLTKMVQINIKIYCKGIFHIITFIK